MALNETSQDNIKEQLLHAATWVPLGNHEIHLDPSYHALIVSIENRREVAKAALNEKSDISRGYLIEMFLQCNKQIASILWL